MNDVGLLRTFCTAAISARSWTTRRGINLGSVYESVVAQERADHGRKLLYYDNRSKGEVDFLIDDYDSLSAVPTEVKSGNAA